MPNIGILKKNGKFVVDTISITVLAEVTLVIVDVSSVTTNTGKSPPPIAAGAARQRSIIMLAPV